jgi:O-antigen ligase
MSARTVTLDEETRQRVVDWITVLLAASLPWSTSATGILSAIWLVAVIFTLRRGDRDLLFTAAGGLPALLVLLGVAGMAWADVSLAERVDGLNSFLKLSLIPLMLLHFRRSERGLCVFAGYSASCLVLLVVSYVIAYGDIRLTGDFGVPAKNAATQSGEFATCLLGFGYLAYECIGRRKWALAALAIGLALAMLANMLFVATGRTALVVVLVLLVLFAALHLTWRGMALVFIAAAVLLSAGLFSSNYLRVRIESVRTELLTYEATDARTSSGERVEFAKRSLEFIREAPFIGHGTGTIRAQFTKAAAGRTGAAGVAAANPHNQTFAVGIQLGLLGMAVLWAMWIAHLLLFRGGGLVAWIGIVVVVQNIVGSAFNSHLFDFLQGWTYVVGVGVAGGMMLRARSRASSP